MNYSWSLDYLVFKLIGMFIRVVVFSYLFQTDNTNIMLAFPSMFDCVILKSNDDVVSVCAFIGSIIIVRL
jgi:hypothetical protein